MEQRSNSNSLPRISQVSLYRREIFDAMQEECGESVVRALGKHPRIHYLFDQDARVIEGYTIRVHTETVVNQFQAFFRGRDLPARMSRGEFLLTLALHDAGKPIPTDKVHQHAATLSLIECIQEVLPFTDHGYSIAKFLIGKDLLGGLIQGGLLSCSSLDTRHRTIQAARARTLSAQDIDQLVQEVTFFPLNNGGGNESFNLRAVRLVDEVVSAAQIIGVDAKELFDLMVIYYQCDTSAYTFGAKSFCGEVAMPGLDFLFVRSDPFNRATYLNYSEELGRLQFVDEIEFMIDFVRSRF